MQSMTKAITLFGIILLMILLQRERKYQYVFATIPMKRCNNMFLRHNNNNNNRPMLFVTTLRRRQHQTFNSKYNQQQQQIRLLLLSSKTSYYQHRFNLILYNNYNMKDVFNDLPSQQQQQQLLSSSSVLSTKPLLNGILNRVNRTLSYKAQQQIDCDNESSTTIGDITNTMHDILVNVTDSINTGTNSNIDNQTSNRMGYIDDTPLESSKSNKLNSFNTRSRNIHSQSTNTTNNIQQQVQQQHPDYSTNPTITTTALAHSLWSYIIRPGIDSAIDATAGNGNDSMMIAKLLFPNYIKNNTINNNDNYNESTDNDSTIQPNDTDTPNQSMLYAIDIQEMACYNTTEKLKSLLPSDILQNHVHVLHMSHHEPIPIKYDSEISNSIALVVYNLGYLPGSNSKNNTNKSITTNTITTIISIQNIIPYIRIGGMISITTYPRTNQQEHILVHLLMESLALFSSQTQNWVEYIINNTQQQQQQQQHQLDTIIDAAFYTTTTSETSLLSTNNHNNNNTTTKVTIRDYLIQTIHQIYNNNIQQKWRVTQHQKLGRIDAPILYTAVRIQ